MSGPNRYNPGEDAIRIDQEMRKKWADLEAKGALLPTATVPRDIDRDKHRKVLNVWNDCLMNAETLEVTWPKLITAMEECK